MAAIPPSDSLRPGSGVSLSAQNLIRAKLGMPVDAAAAALHEEELDDFQRLLASKNEAEFSRIASTIAIDATDSQGMTIGHHAARLGYKDAYQNWRKYYKRLVPALIIDSRGNTPVDLAIIANHLPLIRSMSYQGHGLSKGLSTCFQQKPTNVEAAKTILNVSKSPNLFKYALYMAIADSDSGELVDWLFENWSADRVGVLRGCYAYDYSFDNQVGHPLNRAIDSGDISMVIKMLAKYELRNDEVRNPTPAERAIDCCNDEALRLLIENDLLASSDHRSLLCRAYYNGNLNAFRILVEEGKQDYDQVGLREGFGFLYTAMKSGRDDFIGLLLELGADPLLTTRTGKGLTTLGLLGSLNIDDTSRSKYLVIMGEAGVDLSGPGYIRQYRDGPRRIKTLPQMLVDLDRVNCLPILQQYGVDLTALGEDRENLLHTAVKSRAFDCFKFLVEAGVSLSVKNKDGLSPVDLIPDDPKYGKFNDYLRTLLD